MDYMAEFLAKGGKVTQVETGARAIESDKAIYAAMRDGGKVAGDSTVIARESEAKSERRDEAFRAAKYDGWTDSNAFDYADSAV